MNTKTESSPHLLRSEEGETGSERVLAKPPLAVKPLDLGPIHLSMPIMLSPMAGVTNWPFRLICREYGLDGLYVAEMVTARALVARNPKAFRLCRFHPDERVRSLQLYGVDPLIMEKATRMVIDGGWADHIDMNFGCPVPKVTRHGGGSALPWKLDLFQDLVHRVVAVCAPVGVPVTAKIRVGIDQDHLTFMEAAHIAQEEGCAAVTLHARTTAEYYGGRADWDRISQLVQALDIPVFGNGDIWTAEDALEMLSKTGCAGLAVGRGCQGRPWLFADIRHALQGSPQREEPTLGQVGRIMARHARLLVDFYDGDETLAVHDMRKHVAWYLKGFAVGGTLRRSFMACENLNELDRCIDDLDQDMPYPAAVASKPRGRVRYAKKVRLPYGWLDSRVTSQEERYALFGNDPLDAAY